ncbi:MAG TPA: hypothetical protein VJ992_11915 [Gemmatimonadales bacterium]|jgi:coproporphyrinogen III oxidase|nr:hypothetical protein [Gemmatimonadales bacterium]
MDNGTLALLIPVLALSIPVVAVFMNGRVKIAQARAEEARARASGGGDDLLPVVDQLRAEMQDMHQELVELQERMDFTERVLTQGRQEGRLPRPE